MLRCNSILYQRSRKTFSLIRYNNVNGRSCMSRRQPQHLQQQLHYQYATSTLVNDNNLRSPTRSTQQHQHQHQHQHQLRLSNALGRGFFHHAIIQNKNDITKITKRNYIFFESSNQPNYIVTKIKQGIDFALSSFYDNNTNADTGTTRTSSSNTTSSDYKLQKGKQIMIRLKSINTNTQQRLRTNMKTQMEKMKHVVNTRRYKNRQWRTSKQLHLTNYYQHKRLIFKHKTQHLWTKLYGHKTSMKEWTLRLVHNRKKNIHYIRYLNMKKDFHQYSKHLVTITEPFRQEWFAKEGGYPLTSKDPRTGRFVNPWKSESTNGWKRIEDVWRWKKTRFIGYDMEHGLNHKQHQEQNTSVQQQPQQPQQLHEEEQSFTIPMQLSPPTSSDKIKLTWVGHATMLVQLAGFTILTDPVFSKKASPIQYFSETEFFGVPRRLPPSFAIDDIPSTGVDICLISHDHYDHLDYDSVLQLTQKKLVTYFVVPLGMKEWLMKQAGVDSDQIIELEWWQSVKFNNDSDCNYFSLHNKIQMDEVTKPFGWKPSYTNDNHHLSNTDDTASDQNRKNEIVLTCAPAQHWCSRTPFDRNTRLWCSWAVHASIGCSGGHNDANAAADIAKKAEQLSFYFSGDTGYPTSFPLFRQIGDYLGPFDLAAIPIGAYKPRFFMHDSHCDPFESVNIHKDIRSKRSVAIHWGTFPLANEPYDEPPELLKEAVNKEYQRSGEMIDFISIPHGKSIESKERNQIINKQS